MGKVRGGGVLHERPVIDVVEGEHVVLEDLAQKLPAIIVVGRLVKL